MPRFVPLAVLLALTGAIAVTAPLTTARAGDVQVGDLTIAHAMTRAGLPNRPMAAYMTISNAGAEDDRLISASSTSFKAIELHTVKEESGVFKMLPLEVIDIPAGATAELKSGGMHLMLFGATEPHRAGDSFPVTLQFEKAGAVEVTVKVGKKGHGAGHGHGGGHSGHSN